MKKSLKIVSVISGCICAVSTVLLVLIYLYSAVKYAEKVKSRISSKISKCNERKNNKYFPRLKQMYWHH